MGAILRFLQEVGQIATGVVRPAVGSVRANIGLAALSVILAFGLWIYVTDAENPERPGRVDDVPVLAVNIPADVALADKIRSVTVSVSVEENVINSLTAADFEATVNLDRLAVGEYDLPVDVRALTNRGGLRILGVLPDKVSVKLAQLVSKTVPVTADVKGQPPADFTMMPAKVDDASAVVAGPREKVDVVTQAGAILDVAGRTESIEQAVRLEPRDQRGSLVQGVSLDPAQTQITIRIDQQSFSRAVAVSPEVTGTPDPGYNVTNVSVNPPTVTISVDRSFIQEAIIIRTQPIDIGGADKNIVRTISLDLPPNTKIIGSVTVTVTITITPASGQLLFVVPVGVTGLGDGLSIVGSLPSVQVVLFGPLPTLLNVNSNDIAVTVNLDGKGPGKYRITVRVTAPQGLDVRSTTPTQLEITLEQHSSWPARAHIQRPCAWVPPNQLSL